MGDGDGGGGDGVAVVGEAVAVAAVVVIAVATVVGIADSCWLSFCRSSFFSTAPKMIPRTIARATATKQKQKQHRTLRILLRGEDVYASGV